MGVPMLFRENKIHESQYYCHSQNLNPLKFMPYMVLNHRLTLLMAALCPDKQNALSALLVEPIGPVE